MQNSMMKLTFYVFNWEYPFWARLVRKIKTACLNWNLVPRLIRISRIQWHCSLFVLNGKHLFGANLVQKIKTVNLRWNLVSRLIRIGRIQWWCSLRKKYRFRANLVQNIKIVCFIRNLVSSLNWIWRIHSWRLLFFFRSEIRFLGKFGPQNQNCFHKVKFGIQINLNIQNSMVIFTLSIIGQKYSFWELGPNNQNCEFKLKFVTQSNSNMQNSIVKFAFAVFNWKYRFWANLIQKIKIVSLTLNLVPRLIRICRIQW